MTISILNPCRSVLWLPFQSFVHTASRLHACNDLNAYLLRLLLNCPALTSGAGIWWSRNTATSFQLNWLVYTIFYTLVDKHNTIILILYLAACWSSILYSVCTCYSKYSQVLYHVPYIYITGALHCLATTLPVARARWDCYRYQYLLTGGTWCVL